MTVAELIAILQQAPPNAEVRGSWEGISPEIQGVYFDDRGSVLIDCDKYESLYLMEGPPLWVKDRP